MKNLYWWVYRDVPVNLNIEIVLRRYLRTEIFTQTVYADELWVSQTPSFGRKLYADVWSEKS